MNPELQLAKMLSSDHQKLSSDLSALSIGELVGIFKEAAENTHQSVFRQAWEGTKKGWREGNKAHDRGHKRGTKAIEKHNKIDIDKDEERWDKTYFGAYDKDKKSHAEGLIDFADSLGRELAQKEKQAGLFKRVDLRAVGKKAKGVAENVGRKARDTVGGAASRLSNIKDPIARGAAIGAATGGVSGGVQGFLDPKENPATGEKHRLRTAFRKGLAGAAAGAPTGALFGAMQKSSSVKKLEMVLEKTALGMAGIGSMARNFVASAKPVAQKAMTSMAPALQRGAKTIGGMSMGRAAGAGAMIGGAVGATKGLIAPGKDAQGNTKSRLGGALKSGLSGAGAGGAIGAGAKAALPHLQKMPQTRGLLGA